MELFSTHILWVAVITLTVTSAQFSEDYQKQGFQKNSGSGWFRNSTTSAVPPDSETLESATQITTTLPEITNATLVLGEELLVQSNNENRKDTQHEKSGDFIPANVTSGRSSKALNIDFEAGGVREGRIINEDPGNRRLTLQGFIPIISLSEGNGGESSFLKKSQKRVQDDNQYSNSPYAPQPIEEEKESSYYLNGPHPPHPTPLQSSNDFYDKQRPNFDQVQDFFPQSEDFGTRLTTATSGSVTSGHQKFYIPPSINGDFKSNSENYDKLSAGVSGSDRNKALRYISSDDYGGNSYKKSSMARPDYLPTASNTHFPVDSKKPEEPVYAQAGPYPPEPVPEEDHPVYQGNQDTTAKQFRPGSKQDIDSLGAGYGFNYENGLAEGRCICVPFYMCRNGFLVNNGRSFGPTEQIDERSFKKISKRSAGNETNEDKSKREEPISYAGDISERQIGLSNVGHSCGLLRRCCRVPKLNVPEGLLPFSPDNYPIPLIGDFGNMASGLYPAGVQGFPHSQQNPYQRPSLDQHTILVQQEVHPHPGQNQEHVIIIPQEVRPQRRPKPFDPRPVYPHRKPGNPLPDYKPHYPFPHPQPSKPTPPRDRPSTHQNPVYVPQKPHLQPSYPQPVYQPKPKPTYPHPHPIHPKPKPVYPQPDYSHPPPQVHHGQCGARNGLGIHGRVNNLQYHDDASEFGEYPWQVAILLKVGPGNNLFVCGGTLISQQWVATAAHCLKKHQAEELKVRLGDWDVHRDDEFYPYVEKYVAEVVPHPEFYPGNLHNDLALLRMESPVDPSLPHISPACLPEPHERFEGERCWTTGWGKNAFGEQGEYQSVLKEVDVPMLSHRDCEHRLKQTRLGPHYQLHPGFVCAGGEPGKDACTGDGGSPLVCDTHGTWKVAGLVSWGIGCGQAGVPGIYVNLAKYRVWIDTIISSYG